MHSLKVTLSNRPNVELWERVSLLLFSFGAFGIDEGEEHPPSGENALVASPEQDEFVLAIQPGVLSPPNQFMVYYEEEKQCIKALEMLQVELQDLQPEGIIQAVIDEDYDAKWKASFLPVRCAPHWVIRAPWHSEESISLKKGEREIIVEPGMAFGTGTHETTRACLELLSDAIPLLSEQSRVLDFGCGSGILAIGAKLTGAQEVVALDIDPLALDATLQNAARNKIVVSVGTQLEEPSAPFQLIVANILKNTLLEFSPVFSKNLAPGGFLILSGLLSHQEQEILTHFKLDGYNLEKRIVENDWVALLLKR